MDACTYMRVQITPTQDQSIKSIKQQGCEELNRTCVDHIRHDEEIHEQWVAVALPFNEVGCVVSGLCLSE